MTEWLLALSIVGNVVLCLAVYGSTRRLRYQAETGTWICEALERIEKLEREHTEMETWIRRANMDAGFQWWAPFDQVWAACLRAYREKQYGQT